LAGVRGIPPLKLERERAMANATQTTALAADQIATAAIRGHPSNGTSNNPPVTDLIGPRVGLFSGSWLDALCLRGGERVAIRLAGPEDAEMLQAYVRELSANARYNRFFGPRELPSAELARATRANGSSGATLIAQVGSTKPAMIGELRFSFLADAACELAISIADDWRRKGLGSLLLGELQCRVRALGVLNLVVDVLRSNETTLAFARRSGFNIAARSRDPRAVRILKNMSAPQAASSCRWLSTGT
jgi:GNAT superfamily N-acetyltransferase